MNAGNELNPGQQRKIRIIEKAFGAKWGEIYPDMAIDAVYNKAINDDRKSLFCKIDPVKKDKLAEMLDTYDSTIGDFIGVMIDDYHERFIEQRRRNIAGIAQDYSG
jgi:hypothetical protein